MKSTTTDFVSSRNGCALYYQCKEIIACIKLGIVLAFFLGLNACASVPVENIQTYASAYEQVRIGGDLLYDHVAPLVKQESKDATNPAENCDSSGDGYPECFDPVTALGTAGSHKNEDISFKARRAALASVTYYNIALLDLAGGNTVAEVQRSVDEFSRFIKVFAEIGNIVYPGLAPIATAGTQIAGPLVIRLEQARVNRTLRKAILESKDDIQKIFQLLIDDTPKLYAIYLASKELAIFQLNDLKNRARIEKNLEQQAAYEKQIGKAEEQIRGFHASLGAYVKLLHTSSGALDNLVQAANNQKFSIREAIEIGRETGEQSAKAGEFLNLIRTISIN